MATLESGQSVLRLTASQGTSGSAGAVVYLLVNGARVGTPQTVSAWRWGGATQELTFTFDTPETVSKVELEFVDGVNGDTSLHVHNLSINGVALTAAQSSVMAPWGVQAGSWDLWFSAKLGYDLSGRTDIFGGRSQKAVNGTAGNDTLTGSAGADRFTGGQGADLFRPGGGADVITDFNATAGDRIDLRGTGVSGFDRLTLSRDATGTLVSLPGGGSIHIDGTATPAAGWFLFDGPVQPGAESVVRVQAWADLANNIGAEVYLRVNGERVGPAQYVTAARWSGAAPQDLLFTFTTPAEVTSLEIEFSNDGVGGDRNLYISSLSVNGAAVTPADGRILTPWGENLAGSWDLWYNARLRYDVSERADMFAPAQGVELNGTEGADSLTGGAGPDSIIGAGGDDTLTGGSGADSITGDDGADRLSGEAGADTLAGGAGDDILSGVDGNDSLLGGAGNDILDGGAGADFLSGGDGDDTYILDSAGDSIADSAGNDLVKAGFSYTLADGLENLVLTGTGNINGTGNGVANILTGNAGANRLDGGAGADTIDGGQNVAGVADTLVGGAGNDTFIVRNAGDQVVESAGQGVDEVVAYVDHVLAADVENLTLAGSAPLQGRGNNQDNVITGNVGSNVLHGLGGNDTITASDGADTIDGGVGDDVLSGGTGGDVFRFGLNNGHDRITDFNAAQGDRIDLTELGITGLAQLQISATATGRSIALPNGGSIELTGVGDPQANWFTFANPPPGGGDNGGGNNGGGTGGGPVTSGTKIFSWEGISFPSYVQNRYAGAGSDAALTEVVATGANSVAIIPTFYAQNLSSTSMGPVTGRSETLDSTRHAIDQAHEDGLKVMLKPHVDTQSGDWRAEFRPSDPAAWFASYKQNMLQWAALAQETGAEMLCIGTELDSLTGPAYYNYWADLVQAVRAVYDGPLTYAATYMDVLKVSFWDLVDVIGVDAYIPLTHSDNPTVEQMVAAWTDINSTHDWVKILYGNRTAMEAYKDLSEQYGKKVVFTEVGFRSLDGTNKDPGVFGGGGIVDLAEQADAYTALFQVMTKFGGQWLDGSFIWSWHAIPVDQLAAQGVSATDYTPQSKPAEQVITNGYNHAQQSQGLLLFGDAAADRLDGGYHHDTLSGGIGDDSLWGGAGNDLLTGGPASLVQPIQHTVTMVAAGDLAGGIGPQVYLRVNGERVGPAQFVTAVNGAGQTQTLTFTIDLAATVNSLEIEFANDGAVGTEDRNLFIKSLAINGFAQHATDAKLLTSWGAQWEGRFDLLVGGRLIFDTHDRQSLFPTSVTDKDTLVGGLGDDTLIGGAGDDVLSGGAGADHFLFTGGSGADRILDFTSSGGDVIVLSGISGITSFDQVLAALSAQGGDCIIDLGGGNSIRLVGVEPVALSAANFAFV